MIRLGQLLKLAGVIDRGAEVKALLASGQVTVNGKAEGRRGRQLHPGDRVAIDELELRVSAAPDSGAGEGPGPGRTPDEGPGEGR